MRYLLLIIAFLSFLDARIYRDSTREVVIDDSSKLMWQDDISVVKTLKDHDVAEDYCKELKYKGLGNWRLPEIEEFQLIVDKKNTKNYINKAFRYNVPDGYWALESHWRTLWFYADYMHFVSGTAYYDSRHKKKYIRCVRNY
jgi:hypothetical protein